MTKFINPQKKVLAWKRGESYERVYLFDINSEFEDLKDAVIPESFIGKVRFFRRLVESEGIDTSLLEISSLKGWL